MRAKLKVTEVLKTEHAEVVSFQAVSKKDGYPETGLDEDNTFAKWTPTASLVITITNPDLYGAHEPGAVFYVDFTPAPKG